MFLVGYYSKLEAWLPWTIIVLQFTIYTLMIQLRKLTIETSYNFLSGQHPNPNWACNMSGSVPGRPIKVGNFIMTGAGVWCGQDSAPVNPQKWTCLMDIDGVSEVSTSKHTLSMNGLDNEQKLVHSDFYGQNKPSDLSKGNQCWKSKMKQLAQLTSWKTYEHQPYKAPWQALHLFGTEPSHRRHVWWAAGFCFW